jgi:hypothetical protein
LKREACCVACAMAANNEKSEEVEWGDDVKQYVKQDLEQQQIGEGEEDFELAEEYDDIIL